MARHCARETVILRRLRENRNERLRGTSSPLDVAIEKNTIGDSCPWNLSTVPFTDADGRTRLLRKEGFIVVDILFMPAVVVIGKLQED
jgi:hypothetical protein